MAPIEPIRIAGLAEFNRNLKRLDSELPKVLRLAHNKAAHVIVDYVRPKVPSKTGAAARSVKARSTRTESRVIGGSNKVPYYPWLDFGGRVGPRRSVRRPFYSDGRYIYPARTAKEAEFVEILTEQLIDVARAAGIEVE